MLRDVQQGLSGPPSFQNCTLPLHKPFGKVPFLTELNLNAVVVPERIPIFLPLEDWPLKVT